MGALEIFRFPPRSVPANVGKLRLFSRLDAVAVAAEKGQAVALQRVEAVAGDKNCADAAVMPRGGVAYLSGQPEKGGLAASAVAQSLSTLLGRLEQLKLSPAQVVEQIVAILKQGKVHGAEEQGKLF